MVQEVIGWYKRYRDILNSDIIHLRKPDARDWDGIMHVNPRLREKALAMFFNPTDTEMVRTVRLPLYYTGLQRKTRVREQEGKAKTYRLTADHEVELTVRIPARGFTWYVVESLPNPPPTLEPSTAKRSSCSPYNKKKQAREPALCDSAGIRTLDPRLRRALL